MGADKGQSDFCLDLVNGSSKADSWLDTHECALGSDDADREASAHLVQQ